MDTIAIKNSAFRSGSGLLCDLENEITPEEVRRLERLGYIENAVSPKGETWKLSPKGKAARKLLLGKRTVFSCLSDFFYRHILDFRVSL